MKLLLVVNLTEDALGYLNDILMMTGEKKVVEVTNVNKNREPTLEQTMSRLSPTTVLVVRVS